uniref:Uncharacterized protein n=1 Tax=Glossina austeni TaxID=7395 RepID=A0A1A9UUK1_GLOAU
MGDSGIDEPAQNFPHPVLAENDFQNLPHSRRNANRLPAVRHNHTRRHNRRNHTRRHNRHNRHHNRPGFPYRRRESRTIVEIKECCENMVNMLRRFDLNISSIKDLLSQQVELMKRPSERLAIRMWEASYAFPTVHIGHRLQSDGGILRSSAFGRQQISNKPGIRQTNNLHTLYSRLFENYYFHPEKTI